MSKVRRDARGVMQYPKVCNLIVMKAGHSQRKCSEVSSSQLHCLQIGVEKLPHLYWK